jgi:hypothetical protein
MGDIVKTHLKNRLQMHLLLVQKTPGKASD